MSREAQRILVYGSREFGRVVKDLALQCGHQFAGYIDDIDRGSEILGPWDAVTGTHPAPGHTLAFAVGYRHLKERRALFMRARAQGYATPALIHPRAYVRDPAAIGAGAFVMAGATVDVGALVGEFAVIWPGACISHDSVVGTNTFVSPNATICGKSTVGDDCFIGAGAVVVDHQSVAAGSFIKAGSVHASRK